MQQPSPIFYLGNIIKLSLRGPLRMGLSHSPERFLAPGIRPQTNYPNLYIAGSDLTIDTFSGSIVGSYLAANAVLGYQYFDLAVLSKSLAYDLEQFLEEPSGDGEEAVLYTPKLVEVAPTEDETKVEENTDEGVSAEASKEY